MFFKKIKKGILKPFKKESFYDTIASTKTAEGFYSIIERLPNPDEVLRKAGKGIGVLRSIENHYQVGTCIDSRKAGTKAVKYELKKKDCPENKFKFYKSIFDSIDISQLIDDILDAPLYGFNPIEITWEKQGNYIVPISLTAKPQEWFYFNSDNEFFFKDRNRNGKRQIDLKGYKFLLPRNKASFTNPYGKAVLSRCFWMVAFINGGWEFWAKFVEKYGMPFLFGKYDRSMTNPEKEQLLQGLVDMVADAVGVIPNDGTIEAINPAGSSNGSNHKEFILQCEHNIAKSILGQTLTTDVGSSGSYAASQTHAEVRADIINSDKELVEKTLKQFIKMINDINFNDENMPEFTFVQERDLGLLKAQRDNQIKNLGVRFSKNYFIKNYDYTEEDIECVSLSQNDIENNNGLNFSDSSYTLTSLSQTIKENPLNENLSKVADFFNQTHDAEAALSKLEDLYPQLNSKELEEILAKIIFVAELQGRLDVQNVHK